MKVVYLAAGAGGMYCGSCMRDNRLAATLIAQGRDLTLVPLYTPLRLDEPDASSGPTYYGGLNVYLQHANPLFRRTPDALNRLLDAPLLLRAAGRLAGATKPADLGPLTVSVLRGQHGELRRELAKLIDGLRPLQPDLINLPNLMFAGVAQPLRHAFNVPILCTLSGEDLFLDQLPDPFRTQARDLIAEKSRDIDGFIAVTRYFADHAASSFRLPRDRVHLVPMGIRAHEHRPAKPDPDHPFTIGYLARICPEKGLAALCDAFIKLRRDGRPCRLRIAGYLGPVDRAFFNATLAHLADAGFADDVEHVGEVTREAKLAFLETLQVLSVPTVYREAKGFYVLEALAGGVPVVQPRHGSFPELIQDTGGGLLYDPADPDALPQTIARLMDDETLRVSLARAGSQAVRLRYTDTMMAAATWTLYENFHARARSAMGGTETIV